MKGLVRSDFQMVDTDPSQGGDIGLEALGQFTENHRDSWMPAVCAVAQTRRIPVMDASTIRGFGCILYS